MTKPDNKNHYYRPLTQEEIASLEGRMCEADDWTGVTVAPGFDPAYVADVRFSGNVRLGKFTKTIDQGNGILRHSSLRHAALHDVTIGDDCLIENVGIAISRYTIGQGSVILNVGSIMSTPQSTFGLGTVISVKNEAGRGNIVLYPGLSSQMASLMERCAIAHPEAWDNMKTLVQSYIDAGLPERGYIGCGVRIVNASVIQDVLLGDGCHICGASRVDHCTIIGDADAPATVGQDVIIDHTIVQPGAEVLDGAKVSHCLVGESCHIGRGFSAESSVFFANSYMDNGEACAAFCGPFSVSHHKSTLLIGGEYSFYNAGSATNFSNHAYKMGPIHYGTMARGSKTASGSHVLWPAQVGAFSVCLGKIQDHPYTQDLPFSYLIGSDKGTLLVPGRNIATVGTYRDITKWPSRDKRPAKGRFSMVCYDWLSPLVVQGAREGLRILRNILDTEGSNKEFYDCEGCLTKKKWIDEGIENYNLVIHYCWHETIGSEEFKSIKKNDPVYNYHWIDLAGLVCTTYDYLSLVADIESGDFGDIRDIEHCLDDIFALYPRRKAEWAYGALCRLLDTDRLTDDDIRIVKKVSDDAPERWKALIRRDANREYDLGDVDTETLDDFLGKLK